MYDARGRVSSVGIRMWARDVLKKKQETIRFRIARIYLSTCRLTERRRLLHMKTISRISKNFKYLKSILSRRHSEFCVACVTC